MSNTVCHELEIKNKLACRVANLLANGYMATGFKEKTFAIHAISKQDTFIVYKS